MANDVYITDLLEQRPSKTVDFEALNESLLALSGTMVDQPDQILPQFVDLVMRLTGGVSAGLSLYEENPEPGVFRWKYLRGSLARFGESLIPRHNTPCGVAIDQNRPLLVAHPERLYDWIAAERLVIPEVLLLPLDVGRDEPFGTLWIVAPEETYFCRADEQVAAQLALFVSNALKLLGRESDLKAELDEQEMLAREMSHRLKNLFAMTEGMIHITARNAESPEAMAVALSGRLRALATAHGLLQRRVRSLGSSERTTPVRDLIGSIVAFHEAGRSETHKRIEISGPDVQCGDHAINGVALVIHELATNAAKYGGLSVPTGQVSVHWDLEDEALRLAWIESGGPVVDGPPDAAGFGSTLMRRTVEHQLHGELRLDWLPGGLAVHMSVPMDYLTR